MRALLKEYLDEAAELYKRGGFREEIDYTNMVSSMYECINDIETLRELVGDDVFNQLALLGETFAACRREGHVLSRFVELPAVPKHMLGYKARERHCTECGLTQIKSFSPGGRWVQNKSLYPEGYQLKGVRGKRQVYQRHMWMLVAKSDLDHELTKARRRAGQKGRHLSVA